MMKSWYLARFPYYTDATDDEPDYPGRFSETIPDRALQDGSRIVGVDWSERGFVEVTFLMPGPGPLRDRAHAKETQEQ